MAVGGIVPQVPYAGTDCWEEFFTDAGRETLKNLMDAEFLLGEHWAPSTFLFGVLREKAVYNQVGTKQCDAEPVRAWGATMGRKDLPAAWRKDLRRANTLGMFAL
eukprot:2128708-Amphidinium_carterae.1